MNINDADMSGADGRRRVEDARRKIARMKQIKNKAMDLPPPGAQDAKDKLQDPAEASQELRSPAAMSPERAKELREKAERYKAQLSAAKAMPTSAGDGPAVRVVAKVPGLARQAGEAAQSATVTAAVPEGLAAGDSFGWVGARGEVLEVPVPAGCGPGDALEVEYALGTVEIGGDATRARTTALLAEYRASLGCALEDMEAHRALLDEAMQRYRGLSFRGEYQAAVLELEAVQQWMAVTTEDGCLMLLELAMAYETANDRPAASQLYARLLKTVFPEIRSNARMLLGRLHAVEALGMGDSGREMAKVAQFSLNSTALAAAASVRRRGKATDFVRPMAPDLSQREAEAAKDVTAAVAILRDACTFGVAKPSIASLRRTAPTSRDPAKEISPEETLSAVWRLQIEAEKRWVGTDADARRQDDAWATSQLRQTQTPERREMELLLDGEWTPRFRIRLGEAVAAMAIMRVDAPDPNPNALTFDAGTNSLRGTLRAGPFRAASEGRYSCDASFGRDILRLELPGKMLLPSASVRMRVLHVSGEQGVLVVTTDGLVEVWCREREGLGGDLLRLQLGRDETEVRRWLCAWAEASFAERPSSSMQKPLASRVKVRDTEDGVTILFQPSAFLQDDSRGREAEEEDSGAGEGVGAEADTEGGLHLRYDGSTIRISRCNYGPNAVVKEMSEKVILGALQDAVGERFPAQRVA